MDPITHGLIGAALSTMSGHSMDFKDPVFLGATIGAMLPDLDIITHIKGRLHYLLKHRGASHSFLALGGMALGLSTVLYAFFPTTSWSTIFFWTLVGTLSHGVSDLLNSYGAELLWPFYRKKFTIDMAMLTDPVICLSFLGSVILSFCYPDYAKDSTMSALILSSLYLIKREISRQNVKNSLHETYRLKDKNELKIIPAIYRPFSWNFILLQKNSVRFGIVRQGKPQIVRVLPHCKKDDPSIASALEGEIAGIFPKFTPYFHILKVDNPDKDLIIEFLDLRYWDKENFLYKGQVTMNAEGEITKEAFYPSPKQKGILLGY